jgi:hypothetical protein
MRTTDASYHTLKKMYLLGYSTTLVKADHDFGTTLISTKNNLIHFGSFYLEFGPGPISKLSPMEYTKYDI